MVAYSVWTRVERLGDGRYRAMATATPWNVEQRCAPEERSIDCPSLASAELARAHLAESLCRDVAARGNRVVERDTLSRMPRRHPAKAQDADTQCAEMNG